MRAIVSGAVNLRQLVFRLAPLVSRLRSTS